MYFKATHCSIVPEGREATELLVWPSVCSLFLLYHGWIEQRGYGTQDREVLLIGK